MIALGGLSLAAIALLGAPLFTIIAAIALWGFAAEEISAAAFIIAALQGAFSQAKNAQDLGVFHQCLSGLNDYLKGLRP